MVDEKVLIAALASGTVTTMLARAFAKEFKNAGVFSGGDSNVSDMQKEMDALSNSTKKATDVQDDHTEATKDTSGVLKTLATRIKQTAETFVSADTTIALGSKAAAQGFNDLRKQMEFGTDVSKGLWSNMQSAMDLGIDPGLLSELQARTRQAVNAMGGAEQWSQQIASVQNSMYGHFGDLDQTTQFTTGMLQSLGRAGIQPTIDIFTESQSGLRKTFTDIQKISGATFAELGGMVSEFTEDSLIRWKLLGAATEKQRKTILMETVERHKNLLAMGMNTEQAKRAAAALDQMAGTSPKERMKQAAKMQATMGAMGITGGTRVAELMRKRIRTGDEDRELAEKIAQVQGKISEKQQQSLSGDFFASALLQKSGMDGILGPGSPFDTKLGKVFAEGAETAKNTGIMANMFPELTSLMGEATRWTKNFAENPIFTLMLAGISWIGGMMFKMLALQKVQALLGKKFMGPLPQTKGPFGKTGKLGKVLNILGKFALPLTVAISALETFGETTEQTAASAGFLGDSSTALGRMINGLFSFIRHIGDALLMIPNMIIEAFGFSKIQDWGSNLLNWFQDKEAQSKSSFAIVAASPEVQTQNIAKEVLKPTYMNLKQQQEELNQTLARVVKPGSEADTDIQTQKLDDIVTLLASLGVTAENQNQLTANHIKIAANMAADGLINDEEKTTFAKILKATRDSNQLQNTVNQH